MASSPASKAPSRTIGLKPWLAVLGPEKSNLTMGELTLPAFSAAASALSARLVVSVTGPVFGKGAGMGTSLVLEGRIKNLGRLGENPVLIVLGQDRETLLGVRQVLLEMTGGGREVRAPGNAL